MFRQCLVLAASTAVFGMTFGAPRSAVEPRTPQDQPPNIVLIFPDNLGWGEVGVYGSVRGAPTPRIDRLAS
jgi:hypothetical protein